jgi:hypothetical protein
MPSRRRKLQIVEAVDKPKQGRLATTSRAEQDADGLGWYVQRYVAQSCRFAVGIAHVFNPDFWTCVL